MSQRTARCSLEPRSTLLPASGPSPPWGQLSSGLRPQRGQMWALVPSWPVSLWKWGRGHSSGLCGAPSGPEPCHGQGWPAPVVVMGPEWGAEGLHHGHPPRRLALLAAERWPWGEGPGPLHPTVVLWLGKLTTGHPPRPDAGPWPASGCLVSRAGGRPGGAQCGLQAPSPRSQGSLEPLRGPPCSPGGGAHLGGGHPTSGTAAGTGGPPTPPAGCLGAVGGWAWPYSLLPANRKLKG